MLLIKGSFQGTLCTLSNKIYNFTKETPNSYSGYSLTSMFLYDKNKDGIIEIYDYNNYWPANNGPDEQQPIIGLEGEIVFGNFGANSGFKTGEKLGMATNPAITNFQNYDADDKKREPIYLNGISIEVLSKDANGNMTLNIKFDDYAIDDNIRMCGNIILPPVAVPVEEGVEVEIDKSGTPNRHTKLNGEFINPTEVTLQSNTNLVINDGAKVVVKNNSTLLVKNGATVNIKGKGKLITESGGSIIVEPNGKIIPPNYDESDMFVQNESFSQNNDHHIFAHRDIYIGNDVTATKPNGPVTLQNGTDITFDAERNVIIENDFTVEKGAVLTIETENEYPHHRLYETALIEMYQYTPSYWKNINFPGDYDNPVVIAGPLTTNGWDPATIRISSVTSNACDIQIDEWDYLDGYRLSEQEQMSMLVMEAGQYNIGGLKVEAGVIENVNHNFQSHSFSQNFEEVPVVLTQVITKNDPAAVVTRHRNTSTTSFELRLQEEQAADGIHGNEQVAYIAIEPGYGTFCGQHIEVGRTGTSVNHNWYTINFNNDFTGVPTGFLAQIQSAEGMDPCNLKRKEISSTSVKVMVEEEKSADTEINHTNEVVGYIILE